MSICAIVSTTRRELIQHDFISTIVEAPHLSALGKLTEHNFISPIVEHHAGQGQASGMDWTLHTDL